MPEHSQQYPESLFRKSVPRFKRVAPLIALAAVTSCGVTESSPPTPTMTYEIPIEIEPAVCENPSITDIQQVEALFSQPGIIDTSPKPGDTLQSAEDRLILKRQNAAAEFGLTVFDYRSEIRDLSIDIHSDLPPTIALTSYIDTAVEFVGRYGVTVTIPNTSIPNYFAIPVRPIDVSALSPEQEKLMKYSMLSLIDNIGELPVEFVQESGLKNIIITSIDDPEINGFADYIDGSTFYVDGTRQLGGETFNHELFHIWDAAECSDGAAMFTDTGYTSLNPITDIYVGEGFRDPAKLPTPYTSYSGVTGSSDARTILQEWTDPANYSAENSAQNAASYDQLFAHTVMAKDYGFANAAEDKATMGEEILHPFSYQEMIDERSPILRQKFLYLFARMHKNNPNVVKYFEQVGNNVWE